MNKRSNSITYKNENENINKKINNNGVIPFKYINSDEKYFNDKIIDTKNWLYKKGFINNTNKEVEIKMDNLYRNSKNYFISMQMNQVRKMKEKIGEKEKQIKNNYDSIDKMKKKIEKMENEGRQYERWIEKEEEENENLIYLLNFLIECK